MFKRSFLLINVSLSNAMGYFVRLPYDVTVELVECWLFSIFIACSLRFCTVPPQPKPMATIVMERVELLSAVHFPLLQQAKYEVQECFKSLINFTQLPQRLKEASPTGDVDLVFMDYCRQSSQIKSCINNFLFKVEPCLAESEKSSKYTIQNITETIFDFVCDGQGNNIAVFYTEDGLECIMRKKVAIERCLNTTLGYDVHNITERNSLFSFGFEFEQCRTITKLRMCIIDELMLCTRTTAANVVDSVFNLIHTSTPCSKFPISELSDKLTSDGCNVAYQSLQHPPARAADLCSYGDVELFYKI